MSVKKCVICKRGIAVKELYTSYSSCDDRGETHICEQCMDRIYAPISVQHWQAAKHIMSEEREVAQ